MQKHEGEKKSGLFMISEHEEAHGDLTIKGESTLLSLNARKYFDVPDGGTILGKLHDQRRSLSSIARG